MGKGSGTNTVTTNSQPPQWLQNNLQSVYGQAQNVTSQPLQQYGGSVVAGFTPQQQQAFNTVNNSQGIATPYINSAAQLLGNSSSLDPNSIAQYQSPYTQQVVNATQNQLNQNDAVQQQQLLGSSIASGASPFGGDRAGVASAALAGQQDLSNNQTISNLYNQGYTTALGAAEQNDYLGQQGAAGMANLGTTAQNSALTGANAQLQSGALQQQLNQEQLNIPYEQFIQQQAYPYQQLSALETATGLAGGLAGGTGSTTSPSPSTASQLGGLGLTGLGIYGASQSKDGGAISGFNKGGIAKFASGGGGLPSIPDVSVSYMSNPNTSLVNGVGASGQYQPPQIAHSDIPKAPNAYNSTTQQSQGMGTGIPGMNTGAMGAIGQGAKALYNQAFPASTTGSALTPDFAGAYNAAGDGSGYVAAGASNPIMSGITAGNVGTDAIGTNTGAGLASQFGITGAGAGAPSAAMGTIDMSGLTGASVEGGGDALASSGMLDALGSAGAEYLGADALGSLALLDLRKGGVAKYASGGGSAPVSTSTSATGIAVPQINNDALYNSPSVTVGGDLGGLPQLQNTAPPIVTASKFSAAPASSSSSGVNVGNGGINPQSPPSNIFGTMSPQTYAMIQSSGHNPSNVDYVTSDPTKMDVGQQTLYAASGWDPNSSQFGNDTEEMIGNDAIFFHKKGGVARFADGGDDADYSSMDQAAAPVNYDPANVAKGQGMATGIQNAAIDGYNSIPSASDTPQQQLLSVLDPSSNGVDPLEQQTSAQANITGSHPGFEDQKDPDVKVNTSGNEVTIDHPNGEVVKTGLPVAPKQSNFDKWSPLIAAGLGMMAGTSPFAAVNIGRGGLEGLKQYGENQKETLAQQKEDAEQQYQKGQLTNQSQQINQTGAYQTAQIANEKAKLQILKDQVAQGKVAINQLTGKPYYTSGPKAGQPVPLQDSGSNSSGSSPDDSAPPAFGFPVQPMTPMQRKQALANDGKLKTTEDANYAFGNNALNALDTIDANLNSPDYTTGTMFPKIRSAIGVALGNKAGDVSSAIDTNSNNLVTELSKLQYAPGMRGSVLGLKTMIAGKPGIDVPENTNVGNSAEARGKILDFQLSSELNDQYRMANPNGVTDANTTKLDQALKTIYPLNQIDPKTKVQSFNKENVQKIRDAIPDAIANPKKYLDMARNGASKPQSTVTRPPLSSFMKPGIPATSNPSLDGAV